jgi:hypothetical protein
MIAALLDRQGGDDGHPGPSGSFTQIHQALPDFTRVAANPTYHLTGRRLWRNSAAASSGTGDPRYLACMDAVTIASGSDFRCNRISDFPKSY